MQRASSGNDQAPSCLHERQFDLYRTERPRKCQQRTHHIVQSWDTSVAPNALDFSLAVHSPDRLQLVTGFIIEQRTERLACIAIACCEDYHVCVKVRAVIKLDAGFAEGGDLSVVLQLDLALSDESGRPDIYR